MGTVLDEVCATTAQPHDQVSARRFGDLTVNGVTAPPRTPPASASEAKGFGPSGRCALPDCAGLATLEGFTSRVRQQVPVKHATSGTAKPACSRTTPAMKSSTSVTRFTMPGRRWLSRVWIDWSWTMCIVRSSQRSL